MNHFYLGTRQLLCILNMDVYFPNYVENLFFDHVYNCRDFRNRVSYVRLCKIFVMLFIHSVIY